MPILDPKGSNNPPADWRIVWAELQRFRKMGKHYGQNVTYWRLEFPTRKNRLLKDPRWIVVYSIDGNIMKAFLASNAKDAAAMLFRLGKQVMSQLKGRELAATPVVSIESPPIRPDYRSEEIKNRQRLAEALSILKDFRNKASKMSQAERDRWWQNHSWLRHLMDDPAGWFARLNNWTIADYWRAAPYSDDYPDPPRTKEEHDKRMAELIKKQEQRAEDTREEREAQKERFRKAARNRGWDV